MASLKREGKEMKKQNLLYLALFSFVLSGCVVRTYKVTKDRVDQDLASGNRGYLQGQVPESAQVKERRPTRTTQVVEIELYSPVKFEKMPKPKPAETPIVITEDTKLWGNRGFITESTVPEISQPEKTSAVSMEKYTVQKGDTLQKVSKKLYGTTHKWTKIYEANKDTLKGPDKIYPGQVINIPVEGKVEPLKETPENLK